jgi:hypothetical protein
MYEPCKQGRGREANGNAHLQRESFTISIMEIHVSK